jgi:hypothetical protein
MFPPFPPMAAPPPAIDPATADSVRIRRVVSEGSGQAGAKKPTYSGWSDPVFCLIKGMKAQDVTAPQMIERDIATYHITFGDFPDVGDRDQLSWDSLGKILTVIGVYPIGDPTTRTWIVMAEEHP